MKSKTKINVLRILFTISLIICLFLISTTYARYREQVDANYMSSIKRWKLIVNNEIIREKESLTEVVSPQFDESVYVSGDMFVPGREAFLDMNIDFSNVDVPFSIDLALEQIEDEENYNVLPDFEYYGCYIKEYDTNYYNIPDEYQQVEYIETNGTQFIDTGIITDTNDIETTIKFALASTEGNMWLGGSESYEKTTVIEIQEDQETGEEKEVEVEKEIRNYQTLPYIDNTNHLMKFYAGETHAFYAETIQANKFYKVEQKYNETEDDEGKINKAVSIYINDEAKYDNRPFYGTLKNGRSFWVFANNSETGDFAPCSIKLKELKYVVSDLITIDLVPCYRKSDGVVGLYEMATGEFFSSQGAEPFLKGEDIKKVVIDPNSEEYKRKKNAHVKAFIKWVDGDGTTESLVDEYNNMQDTDYALNEENINLKYKATLTFEQYIEE
ncbi:MAG: hypothetical protein IKL55_05645 [Clostridia bacterium]|nr:hypothetical protein [Clostridia bacterium]